MAELILHANGTNLTIENKISIVGTQVNYDTCRFEFDDAWNGYTKTAVFYQNPAEKSYIILDETNACPFPWESVQDGGLLYIGVFGMLDDVILPTNFVIHRVITGSHDGIAPPTEDVYAQIIAIMQQQAGIVGAHKADTENPHEVTKAQVGLGNVDNTSDLNKPISTAQAAAIGEKVNAILTDTETSDTFKVSFSLSDGELSINFEEVV